MDTMKTAPPPVVADAKFLDLVARHRRAALRFEAVMDLEQRIIDRHGGWSKDHARWDELHTRVAERVEEIERRLAQHARRLGLRVDRAEDRPVVVLAGSHAVIFRWGSSYGEHGVQCEVGPIAVANVDTYRAERESARKVEVAS